MMLNTPIVVKKFGTFIWTAQYFFSQKVLKSNKNSKQNGFISWLYFVICKCMREWHKLCKWNRYRIKKIKMFTLVISILKRMQTIIAKTDTVLCVLLTICFVTYCLYCYFLFVLLLQIHLFCYLLFVLILTTVLM